jgi:hypothetical protein
MSEPSPELKRLGDIFKAVQAAHKESKRARGAMARPDMAGNAFAAMAGAVLSHVEGALQISVVSVESQLQQQKKIEELERRIEELEATKTVRLAKPAPKLS